MCKSRFKHANKRSSISSSPIFGESFLKFRMVPILQCLWKEALCSRKVSLELKHFLELRRTYYSCQVYTAGLAKESSTASLLYSDLCLRLLRTRNLKDDQTLRIIIHTMIFACIGSALRGSVCWRNWKEREFRICWTTSFSNPGGKNLRLEKASHFKLQVQKWTSIFYKSGVECQMRCLKGIWHSRGSSLFFKKAKHCRGRKSGTRVSLLGLQDHRWKVLEMQM